MTGRKENIMTNTAMINEVENRMNDNVIMFPIHFTKSKAKFAELDAKIIQYEDLKREIEKLTAEANDEMFKEYMENEQYRLSHEFLSAAYKNKQIGDGVLENLDYGNSRAIQDHEGRWFRTIKDACKYHGVKYATFINRRKRGLSLEKCFSTETFKRGRKKVGDAMTSK